MPQVRKKNSEKLRDGFSSQGYFRVKDLAIKATGGRGFCSVTTSRAGAATGEVWTTTSAAKRSQEDA
jgi:hypothetical protein